jgi:hypothetical protein
MILSMHNYTGGRKRDLCLQLHVCAAGKAWTSRNLYDHFAHSHQQTERSQTCFGIIHSCHCMCLVASAVLFLKLACPFDRVLIIKMILVLLLL